MHGQYVDSFQTKVNPICYGIEVYWQYLCQLYPLQKERITQFLAGMDSPLGTDASS